MLSDGQLVDGKYRVGPLLGEGGMGAVYEATEEGSGNVVALKVVLVEHAKDKIQLARFQREARAAAAIESRHIAKLIDAGVDAETGRPYLAMERLRGEDVQQLVRRLGPLPPRLALCIAAQACVGLAKAHDADIIHRDIKSANVYVAEAGDTRVVKLLDFGVAKMRRSPADLEASKSLTQTGGLVGSPLYMSPEQAIGAKTFDARTDIFSLGVVLFEMLTGRVPHERHDTLGRLIIAICQEPAAHVQGAAPWVPAPIAAIVHKALEIDPGDRYPSPIAMLDAIGEVLEDGWEIENATIRPLTVEERAVQEPRAVLPRAREAQPAVGAGGDGDVALTRTDNGHDTTVRTHPRTMARRLAVGTLAGVALVAGVAMMTRQPKGLAVSERTATVASPPPPTVAAQLPVSKPLAPTPPAPLAAAVPVGPPGGVPGANAGVKVLPRSSATAKPAKGSPATVPAPPTSAAPSQTGKLETSNSFE